MKLLNTHIFTINGEPVPYPENKSSHFKTWSPYRHYKGKYQIDISNQFEGNEMLTGPLFMEILFYFSTKKGQSKSHLQKPDLNRLVRFIEELCCGIVYEKDYLFTHIFASKGYDEEPKTVFKISKIAT